MSIYVCPFCQHTIAVDLNTHNEVNAYFILNRYIHTDDAYDTNYNLIIDFYKCPNCKIISSTLKYKGKLLPELEIPIYPTSQAKQYPEYIPKQITDDYREAYEILNLSPKA